MVVSPLLAIASGGDGEAGGKLDGMLVPNRSWATVVKPRERASVEQPASINQKKNLEKLKKSVNDVVMVEKAMKTHATNRMENFLFEKFLGKAPLPA